LQRYKQQKLLAAQVAQAKELSEIGSGTVFKANQELFNVTGAF
jgi:hypothetical protein